MNRAGHFDSLDVFVVLEMGGGLDYVGFAHGFVYQIGLGIDIQLDRIGSLGRDFEHVIVDALRLFPTQILDFSLGSFGEQVAVEAEINIGGHAFQLLAGQLADLSIGILNPAFLAVVCTGASDHLQVRFRPELVGILEIGFLRSGKSPRNLYLEFRFRAIDCFKRFLAAQSLRMLL